MKNTKNSCDRTFGDKTGSRKKCDTTAFIVCGGRGGGATSHVRDMGLISSAIWSFLDGTRGPKI